MGGEVSVFEEGELEQNIAEAEAGSGAGAGSGGVWDAMTTGYGDVINLVIRPPRAAYVGSALGPPSFEIGGSIAVTRTDFALLNGRGLELACSRWECEGADEGAPRDWLVYVHGGSGCRVEALGVLPALLAAGVNVMALDTTGSGQSEGAHVSLGYFESDDVAAAVDFLRARPGTGKVAVWGRSFGAAATLLFAEAASRRRCYTVPYTTPGQPFGLHLQPSQGQDLDAVVYERAESCPPEVSRGDQLVAIGSTPVRGRSFEAIVRLLQEAPRPITLTFETHSASSSSSPSANEADLVDALIIDSCFSDLATVAAEVVSNAQALGLFGSSLVLGVAMRAVRRSIKSTAGFDFQKILPEAAARQCVVPALFMYGSRDDFLPPASHTHRLVEAYGGPAELLEFEGGHDERRPAVSVEAAVAWLLQQLGRPPAPAIEEPPAWLRSTTWHTVGGDDALQQAGTVGAGGINVDALPLLSASVTGYDSRQDITGPFTAYVVSVARQGPRRRRGSSVSSLEEAAGVAANDEHDPVIRFSLERRYNEFKALRAQLAAEFPQAMASAPAFPEGGARAFSSRFHPQRLQQRADAFQELLAFIVARTVLREAPALAAFLHHSQGV